MTLSGILVILHELVPVPAAITRPWPVCHRCQYFVRLCCQAWLDTSSGRFVASSMKIRNVIHKGLRRFIEDDDVSGLQPAVVPTIRRIVSFLQDMEREDELRSVPSWKAH